MIEFNKYYRYNCVLKKAQLYSPPVISLPDTGLPFWTTLHFTTMVEGVVGIDLSNPVIRGIPKESKIITGFNRPDPKLIPGKVVTKGIRPNEIISKYMRTVPKWKRLDLEPSFTKIKENVLVYNYGLYQLSTSFQESALSGYHNFLGYWNNVVGNITNILHQPKPRSGVDGISNRNHFIMIETPEILPSLKILNDYSTANDNVAFIEKLGTESRLLIGELWKWLGGYESIFSKFTDTDLQHVNIMFTRASSACIINLYVLKHLGKPERTIQSKEKPTELFVGQDFNQLAVINLQKALLMLLISFKTKVDKGTVSQMLTGNEIDGNGQVVADDENAENLKESILGKDDPDAPTEKAVTQQFIADTTDAGENMDSIFTKKERNGLATKLVKAAQDKKDQSDELEDIFSDSNTIEESEQEKEKAIDETLETLEEINNEVVEDEPGDQPFTMETDESSLENALEKAFKKVSYKPYVTESQNPEESFMRLVQAEADAGNLSAAEVRRFEALSKKYRTTIKNPFGEGTLKDGAYISPEDLLIPENNKLAEKIPGVFNDSFLESSHDKMHRHYNSNILKKDILSNSIQLMKAGYAIGNYEVHTHNDIVDSYEIHTIQLIPIRGKPSTIKFKVPIVSPNGTFKAGGNINRMRVQRADIPIRKVSPGEVALTSYHSKMWVRRSPLVAFNYDKWIEKTITAAATNPDRLLITNVSYGNCFNSDITAPLMFTAISRYFTSFSIGKLNFMFDVKRNDNYFGKEVNEIAKRYTDDQVMCGKGENSILWMDNAGVVYEAPMEGRDNAKPLGTITDLIGIDPYKIPVQSADLKIFSKSIPIGIALAYWIGLGNLLSTIGAKYRRVNGRTPLNLQPNEFYVKFKNETLVFDRNEELTALIMSGWNEYHAFIKFYSPYDFDKKDTFGRFFYETKIEGRYENELTIIRQLWIDPITEGELIRLKEPTDMVNLFISAVKKLTYDKHPDPMDGLYQRDRGYERISGFVYDNMVRSVRGHRNRRFMKDASIDMPPDVVWYDILKDQTTGIAEFSNPIHSLKEQEVVVFRGAGGRSSQSMMASDRKAHRSNVGRDSEATVDSGDVATVLYTTANPNYDSVRGTIRYTEKPNENIARAFGTSQLLAPAAEYDD